MDNSENNIVLVNEEDKAFIQNVILLPPDKKMLLQGIIIGIELSERNSCDLEIT